MNKKYIVYSLPILLILVLVLVFFPRQKSFIIMINEVEQNIESSKTKVEDILIEAAIPLNPEDRVEPALDIRIKDGDSIEIIRAVSYLIMADGESERILTPPSNPKEIFSKIGLQYNLNDLILVDGEIHPYEKIIEADVFASIEVRRSFKLTVEIGTDRQSFQTTAATIGEALWEANISFYHNEQLSLPIESPLLSDTNLIITPAQEIEILIGENRLTVHSSEQTVGEVLAQAGISLQNLDYSLPPEDQAIPIGGIIEVVRVEESILGEQELIPFMSLLQAMPDVEIDTQSLLQVGEYGLKTHRIRVRYENGVEVERNIEDEWIVRDPVPRIEGFGTYIDLKVMDTPDGPIEYWRELEFYVTSYSPSRSGTPEDKPWWGLVYCTGEPVQIGYVGVDVSHVPCGTPLYIPGYGFAFAMDTGNITGAWIDLGYPDDEYIPWHQFVTVYFLTPVPPAENISWKIPPGSFY